MRHPDKKEKSGFFMTIMADKVIVSGPKVDGGYSIKFEVGEYEQENVAKLLLLPRDEALKVTVEVA